MLSSRVWRQAHAVRNCRAMRSCAASQPRQLVLAAWRLLRLQGLQQCLQPLTVRFIHAARAAPVHVEQWTVLAR